MNTEFDKQPGQRKRLLLVSGAIALCLFVAALLERRKVAAAAEAARRARSLADSGPSFFARPAGVYDAASTWAPAGPVGEPVWEDNGLSTPGAWPTGDAFAAVEEAEVFDSAHESELVAEADAPSIASNESRGSDAVTAAHTPLGDDNRLVEVDPFVEAIASAEPEAEVETWGSAPAPYAPWGSPSVELPRESTPVAEPPAEIEHAPEPDASWPRTTEPGPWRPAPAFGSWQPGPEVVAEEPVAEEPVEGETVADESVAEEAVLAEHPSEDHASDERHAEEPVPAVDHWFGSYAPSDSQQSSAADQHAVELYSAPEPIEATAHVEASHEPDAGSVIELPSEAPAESPAAPDDPKRLPPPRLRRFMGTGASVLVLGLVLGAGFLVSGATADSTSDPATVPNAVATTTFVPDVVADTTTPDTTGTDTTSTGTTTTDTTTTDTTTTDTTTTDTTTTDTTATTTTPTDTTTTDTTTTTTSTDPATTTPPPTETTPVAPPASDPAPVPADVPPSPAADTPPAPAVTPPAAPTAPAAPATPVTKKHAPTHHAPAGAPAKSTSSSTPKVGLPAQSGTPVVTLASGADPIGSILSAHAVIPAVDASLLPTPAQVSFYVKASKPLAPLPSLVRIGHPVAQRLVAAGRHARVGWTVLAAVARLESNLGERPGLLAGRGLPSAPTGDGLAALASFLHAHGAKGNPLAPATAKKALTVYFDGSTRKADRAIALAALYGALGPAGMQHGVRAETARLQKRVLRDTRVHLTIAGRSDIRHGRVDPRVLVTLEYLANSFHKVGISDLVSGGALFSRSGSVSAHLYGRAADVASLHGTKVRGHQGPGTMTEQAIRKLLLLPKSLRPRQVISLMDVDGPTGNHGSFALPDHYDRIQIDY